MLAIYGIDLSSPASIDYIGIRTGWVALTQVPLLLLLSARGPYSPLSLTGISYERMQWAHHWVGRAVAVFSAVHGICFVAEWIPAGTFWIEWRMMLHAKYGVFSMAILLWIGISSLVPIRRWSYETFVLQHRVFAVLFLAFLYWHLPRYHRTLAVVSFAVLAWNAITSWVAFFVLPVLRRQYGRAKERCSSPSCRSRWRVTSEAALAAVGDGITVLQIKDVHFPWQAGQHVLVWVPRLWWHTAHPFTIVSGSDGGSELRCQDIQLVMRTKTGLTRSLNRLAGERGGKNNLQIFISEPCGTPPRLEDFETVVLASSSTGASFTLSILEGLMNDPVPSVRQLHVLLVARDRSHIEVYLRKIFQMKDVMNGGSLSIKVDVAISQLRASAPEEAGEEFAQDEEEGEMERLMIRVDESDARDIDDDNFELEMAMSSTGEKVESPYSGVEDAPLGTLRERTHGFYAKRAQRSRELLVPSPLHPTLPATTAHDVPSLTGRTIRPDNEHADDQLYDFTKETGISEESSDSDRRQSRDETVIGSVSDEEKTALEDDRYAGGTFKIHEAAGRPDLRVYLEGVMNSSMGRVAIVTCGGGEFIGAVRRAYGQVAGGKEAWFHAEEFG